MVQDVCLINLALFPLLFSWLVVLLITPKLKSPQSGLFAFKDIIRVNFKLSPSHISVLSGSEF